MKSLRCCLQTLFLLANVVAHGQSTFVYDQQSANENNISGAAVIQVDQPGQSFTPSLSSVGFIRLALHDFNVGNSLGATVFVNLRADSITGPILATSMPAILPDGFFGVKNFFFSTPAVVDPGATYYFEPVVLTGGDLWDAAMYHYGYSGGTAFLNGAQFPNADLWFREGVVVPEPSIELLFVLGGGILFGFDRFRRTKRTQPVSESRPRL